MSSVHSLRNVNTYNFVHPSKKNKLAAGGDKRRKALALSPKKPPKKGGPREFTPEEAAQTRTRLKAYLIARKVKLGRQPGLDAQAESKAVEEYLDYLRWEE